MSRTHDNSHLDLQRCSMQLGIYPFLSIVCHVLIKHCWIPVTKTILVNKMYLLPPGFFDVSRLIQLPNMGRLSRTEVKNCL